MKKPPPHLKGLENPPSRRSFRYEQPSSKREKLLEIIDKWLRDRYKTTSNPHTIKDLQDEFVGAVLEDIKKVIPIEEGSEVLVTVRSSFIQGQTFLRPVYSNPQELASYFQESKKQRPFSLRYPYALKGLPHLSSPAEQKDKFSFVAAYRLNSKKKDEGDHFGSRIDSFRARLGREKRKYPRSATLVSSASHCFFAGQNKDKVPGDMIEVKHLLAIYFKGSKDADSEMKKGFEACLELTKTLFTGLDLISRIDAGIFQADGLQLVADLLPSFSRKEIASADKIAFAIEKLKSLLENHIVGRHGGESPVRLFYVATTFEKHLDHTVTPRLELYPHTYRKDHAEVSFLITHRLLPSATKFLIYRYLTNAHQQIIVTTPDSISRGSKLDANVKTNAIPVKPSLTYAQLFDDDQLGTDPKSNWREEITPENQPDLLRLTVASGKRDLAKRRKTPWDALQQPPDSKSKSIAAFVVEGPTVPEASGETVVRHLPRGIFAIESDYEDGFSDDDIDSLRIVFRGLASLIRLISHEHAPIDYRSQVAKTFESDLSGNIAGKTRGTSGQPLREKLGKLLFMVQKLDADVFSEFLIKHRSNLRRYHLDANDIGALEEIQKCCPPHKNPSPKERIKILGKRMEAIIHILEMQEDRERFIKKEVVAFLEACPENFTWASYLACMAQTLGDRVGTSSDTNSTGELPGFKRMVPGFSASGMFMAMVDGELRQVVKLSNREKLKKENDLYRKWVRYRLVNAARIPKDGFAFETTGIMGKHSGTKKLSRITPIDPEDEKYKVQADEADMADGVLVSDLVSGEHGVKSEVRTMLDIVARRMTAGSGDNSTGLPTIETIGPAIGAVFRENAALWDKVDRAEIVQQMDQQEAIFAAFRIPTDSTHEDRIQFESAMTWLEELESEGRAPANLKIDALLRNTWKGERLFPRVTPEESCWAITHGDLNARNLTWAEGLKSFFLIDFEHVGHRLKGSDQMRLVVSLISEVWQCWETAKRLDDAKSNQLPDVCSELELAIRYLAAVFRLAMRTTQPPKAFSTVADEAAGAEEFKTSRTLVPVLNAVLTTVEVKDMQGQPHVGPEWLWHWAVMLLYAAANQFRYTVPPVEGDAGYLPEGSYALQSCTRDDVKKILDSSSLRKINFHDLSTKIDSFLQGRTGARNLRFVYIAHFVSGRLCSALKDELDELCRDE